MKLPDQNIVGRTKCRQIMQTDDWAKAKKGDFRASTRIIEQLWSDNKTKQLKQFFTDPERVVFISQPSTSGYNVLAGQLAKFLADAFKTDFILGDDFAISTHPKQSKQISFNKRAFHPREYTIIDSDLLRETISDKEVCLVEDVMTSGGSVAAFTNALSQVGIEIKSIAALTGEKRLNIDEKTHERLEQTLKAKNINVDIEALTNSLTRTEAGGIIMLANTAKTDIAIKELQDQLEGRIQYEKGQDLQREHGHALEELKSDQEQETMEQYHRHEKENSIEMETRKPGPDHKLDQFRPEIEETEGNNPQSADLKLPQLDTEYVKGWNQGLNDNQKLVDQEYSIEMSRGQEKLQKKSRQLGNQEKALDREPQFELGR